MLWGTSSLARESASILSRFDLTTDDPYSASQCTFLGLARSVRTSAQAFGSGWEFSTRCRGELTCPSAQQLAPLTLSALFSIGLGMILLQTLSRLHVCATLALAQSTPSLRASTRTAPLLMRSFVSQSSEARASWSPARRHRTGSALRASSPTRRPGPSATASPARPSSRGPSGRVSRVRSRSLSVTW